MDAFGRFLSEQMRDRGWSQADLARRSSLSRQNVSSLINGPEDGGPRKQMLHPKTVKALNRALLVGEGVIVLKVAEAMGMDVDHPDALDPDGLPNAVLIDVLRRRLDEGGSSDASAADADNRRGDGGEGPDDPGLTVPKPDPTPPTQPGNVRRFGPGGRRNRMVEDAQPEESAASEPRSEGEDSGTRTKPSS